MKKLYSFAALLGLAAAFTFSSSVFALTANTTYTISVQEINSDGTLAIASSSTTATADSNGKISDFALSSIPDNTACNFMVISVTDAVLGTVERRAIVPCPAANATVNFGVSNITDKQTEALIAALAAAGTDDPINVVFGFTIVRTNNITSSELAFMATLANQGINGTGGYVDYLLNTAGLSSATVSAYRSAIVAALADPTSGYSKTMKQSVDNSTGTNDSAAELEKRGEAAAKLLQVLVESANTAGFSPDVVLEAFNAMGSIVVPLMDAAVISGDLTAGTKVSIDSSIGGGINKLNAERNVRKYVKALEDLGATGSDVTQFTSAVSVLSDQMEAAFSTFEKVFDGNETQAEVQAAQATMDTAIRAAFATFQSSIAASNARLITMASDIGSAITTAGGTDPNLQPSDFTFLDENGNSINWPVTMVILMDYISNVVGNGGSFTYTRDTTPVPSNAGAFLGSCDTGDPTHGDETTCQNNGGNWTTGRTNFNFGAGVENNYANIFAIQEDIMILEFVRWAAEDQAFQNNSGEPDFDAMQTFEKNFRDGLTTLAGNISGTTDGSTAISSVEKNAIITTLKSPQL